MTRSTIMFDGGHSSSVVGSVGEVQRAVSRYKLTYADAGDSPFLFLDTAMNSTAQVAVDVNRVVAIAGRDDSPVAPMTERSWQ